MLITVARKPLIGTVVQNVLQHECGGINVDGTRVRYTSSADQASATPQGTPTSKVGALAGGQQNERNRNTFKADNTKGRWPANVIVTEQAAVLEKFPEAKSGAVKVGTVGGHSKGRDVYGAHEGYVMPPIEPSAGSAARFFKQISGGDPVPTFNYKCPKCGHKFEGEAKANDPNPTCPALVMVPYPPPCQRGSHLEPCGETVEKNFDYGVAPAVHFQGGGWAKDGYSK